MAENCKDPRASAQTPLGGFTVATTNLHNFHFVKTINGLYGLPPPPFIVWDPPTVLIKKNSSVKFQVKAKLTQSNQCKKDNLRLPK